VNLTPRLSGPGIADLHCSVYRVLVSTRCWATFDLKRGLRGEVLKKSEL